MKKVIVGVIIISFSLLLKSCNTTEPPPPGDKPTLLLKLEDVSCTEAWIELITTNLQLPATISLYKNSVGQNIILSHEDTLLYIDSLLPNSSYQYQASSIQYQVSSSELTVTTMDTTSHNFTFQTWTFGTIGSSTLYDVAIINENNIWCVGDIMIADTSINGYTTYNAVHWDGSAWGLKRVYFPTVCGQTSLTSYPAKAIFAFDDGQIWISSSGDKIAILRDGNQVSQFCLPWSFSINKIWGSSSNDLYVVGNNGNIARYLNGTWSRINSGTNLNINDIWGTIDNEGNQFILCTAYNFATGGVKKLLQIRNFVVDEIPWVDNRELYTVWFDSKYKIYVGGEGLFYRNNNEWREESLPALFKFKVRGTGLNDIWTIGGYGFAAQDNGKSWKTFEDLSLTAGNYLGLALKENTVVMVGNEGNKAVISLGRR